MIYLCVIGFPGLSVRENVTLPDPEPNGSTNSSSVAVAILVPFFALIFAGLGFYLYRQRYVLCPGVRLRHTHTHTHGLLSAGSDLSYEKRKRHNFMNSLHEIQIKMK